MNDPIGVRRSSTRATTYPWTLSGRYRPGERGWVKTKNRSFWRWEMERESALNRPRVKRFV
jgi:hypothetical protein